MPKSPDKSELNVRALAELSMLADGTLDPARRAEVESRIEQSPELRARYERERRVVEALHEARRTVRAPTALRTRIEAERPTRSTRARRRISYGGALAGALAAVALALVLILPAGSPGSPSVSQAAALALRGPAAPPPAPDPSAPRVKLGRDIEDVYFPNWMAAFDWRAVGERSDRVDGRRADTVYYQWHGKQIAYTIVAAPALREPAAQVRSLNGTQLRTLNLGGRLVVTWRRAGHTCVLSGSGVTAGVLQELAAWKVPGEIR
jgi:hypothetical protein